jgi:hypothetical protein
MNTQEINEKYNRNTVDGNIIVQMIFRELDYHFALDTYGNGQTAFDTIRGRLIPTCAYVMVSPNWTTIEEAADLYMLIFHAEIISKFISKTCVPVRTGRRFTDFDTVDWDSHYNYIVTPSEDDPYSKILEAFADYT